MQDFFEDDSLRQEEGEGLDIRRYWNGILQRWWILLSLFLEFQFPGYYT